LLQPIDISKGVFLSVNAIELPQAGFASDYRNLLKNDAGSDVDRPALSEFATIGANPIEGLFYFKPASKLVAVTFNLGGGGRRVWSIDSSAVVTNITGSTLDGTSRPVFASDGTYLAIAGGDAPLQWNGSGTTTALAGSPEECTHISYLDGYWINHLLNDQEFRWAGPTSAARATWNSSNFFQAEGLPDNIKAQYVLFRELYAFGEETTEIYQNFGTTSTPFQRTFFLERGIAAPYSVVEADNTLYWLDNRRNIVRMEGRTPIIKSDAIATEIKAMTTVSDCFASRIDIGNHFLIIFTFPTEEKSYCFDYKRGEWGIWDGYVAGVSDRLDINSYCYVPDWNKHLVGSAINGKIYELSFSNKTDNGNVLRRKRVVNYDHGTNNRKRSNYYLFHLKRNVATTSVTNPVISVRVNDDNKGWSEPQLIELGALGTESTALRVRLGGIYRRRELEIEMTDAAEFVLSKIEEETEGLAS
jgi:hypothetical protein